MQVDLISSKEAALALGVSQSSIKRWCDQGKLPAVRTVGGHRKVPVDAVLQLAREQGIVLSRPELLGLVGVQRTQASDARSDRLLEALLDDDTMLCGSIIIASFAEGRRLSSIFDDLIGPAMREIGERWHSGSIGVDQERRACQIVLNALQKLESSIVAPAENAPVAIGGTIEGDFSEIGTRMVELILRQSGWKPHQLGAGLPFKSLADACQRYKPKLFWLSVTHLSSADWFIEEYTSHLAPFVDQGIPIVLGGRVFDSQLRSRLRFSFFGDNMQQLEDYCRSIKKASFE